MTDTPKAEPLKLRRTDDGTGWQVYAPRTREVWFTTRRRETAINYMRGGPDADEAFGDTPTYCHRIDCPGGLHQRVYR